MKKAYLILTLLLWNPFLRALPIDLNIHELLPEGETGITRPAGSPASFGVPLRDIDGITSVNQLAVSGTTDFQFKALKSHASGNIQWVLVDLLSPQINANTTISLQLVSGSGNSAGTDLASESSNYININTGIAQFSIRKNGFNGLDSVVVSGEIFVNTGHSGGFEFHDGSQLFSSLYDNPLIEILENGPVKSIVKVDGRFKNSSLANAPMGYNIFFTFFKGSAQVKTAVTLKNAYDSVHARVAFHSFEWVIPGNLGANKQFEFASSVGLHNDNLAPSDTAFLFQGYTRKNAGGDFGSWNGNDAIDLPVSNNAGSLGVWIQNGSQMIKALGNDENTDYSLGYGEIKDVNSKGITIAYRNMASYFPSGIEFSGDGQVSVGLFSKRNPKSILVFDWGCHESRDLLVDFHTGASNNERINKDLQCPLFGRAPFNQYRESGAFHNEFKLASYSEQQNIYADLGRPDFEIPNLERKVVRIFDHNDGGTLTQRDFNLANQIDFARMGHGGQLLNALQHSLFMAEQFAWRSDDFDFGAKPNNYLDTANTSAGRAINGGYWNKHEQDFEHIWVYGLYTAYYMTGDLRYKQGVIDLGESVFNRTQTASAAGVFSRSGLSAMRMDALSFDFTGINRYLDGVDRRVMEFMSRLIKYPDSPRFGREANRGYIINSNDGDVQEVHSLFVTNYLSSCLAAVLNKIPKNHVFGHPNYPGLSYSYEDVKDAFTGAAYFTLKEAYSFEENTNPKIPYRYVISHNEGEIPPNSGGRTYACGMYAALAYEFTGDSDFLDRGCKMARWISVYDQHFIANSDIGFLRTLYNKTYPDTHPQGLVPLTVVNHGGGSYTLSWTVPNGSIDYQLKISNRVIVPDLGYDKTTCQYRYDPEAFIAFWSADNYEGEPLPQTAGSIQTLNLSGLADNLSFALLTQGGPGIIPPDSYPPLAPSGLSAVALDSRTFELHWQDNAVNETGIEIERAINSGPFNPLTQISRPNAMQFTDTGLTGNTVYNYRLRAYNASGPSAYTSELSVTTPIDNILPKVLSVSNQGRLTQLLINFSEPIDPSTGENIANYSLSPLVTVQSAVVNGNTVTLQTAPFSSGIYTLTLNHILDTATPVANAILANTQFTFSASAMLVDFGPNVGEDQFLLANWNTLFKDVYTNNRNYGPGGMTITVGDNPAYNFQGVQGVATTVKKGDKIVVTWYNQDAISHTFTPRISFNSTTRPANSVGQWTNMTTITLAPQEIKGSVYEFTSDQNISLVNIAVNYANDGILICDKIEWLPYQKVGISEILKSLKDHKTNETQDIDVKNQLESYYQ